MVTKKDTNYWENILASEWLWDIDKKEWFKEIKLSENDILDIQEEIENTTNLVDNILSQKKSLEENDDLMIKINQIEKKYSINIVIDTENKKINFIDKISWELVWEMYDWVYNIWDETYNHTWIEIWEKYKWKWLWKIIFELYNEVFWVLNEEFTRKYDTYKFYKKVWYNMAYIIDEKSLETIIPLTEKEIENLLNRWFYTIVLVKK